MLAAEKAGTPEDLLEIAPIDVSLPVRAGGRGTGPGGSWRLVAAATVP